MWSARIQLRVNPGIDGGVPMLPGFRYYLQARAVMFGLSVIPEARALMYQKAVLFLCRA